MTKKEAINLGFKKSPHFTIGDSLIYDLGGRKILLLSDLETMNEMFYICQTDYDTPSEITDVVVLHNHDFDSALQAAKVRKIIEALRSK